MSDELLYKSELEILGGLLIIPVLTGIACWIYSSIVLMKFLKNNNYAAPVLAWVPFFNIYAWATCLYENSESVEIELIHQTAPKWLFQWYSVVVFIISIILVKTPIAPVSSLFLFAAQILLFGQMHKDSMRANGIEISTAEIIAVGLINLISFIRIHTTMVNRGGK
jgi:hypothetical protein